MWPNSWSWFIFAMLVRIEWINISYITLYINIDKKNSIYLLNWSNYIQHKVFMWDRISTDICAKVKIIRINIKIIILFIETYLYEFFFQRKRKTKRFIFSRMNLSVFSRPGFYPLRKASRLPPAVAATSPPISLHQPQWQSRKCDSGSGRLERDPTTELSGVATKISCINRSEPSVRIMDTHPTVGSRFH